MNLSQKSPPQVESALVVDLFVSGRYAELEARTRKLVGDFPEVGLFWKALGASIQMQGREKEALPALQRAADLMPDDAPAQCNLGRALHHTGQADAAKARFLRALVIKPDFADAHNNLGTVLDEFGQHQEAVASYRRAVQSKPDFAEAHANLAGALRSMGQLEDAAASYRRALEIKPEYVQAHNRLGVVLRSLGHVEEAEACHRRALAIDPDHASAHNNLAIALQDLGQFDAALESCRRALEIDPDFASAHINLGCALEALWRLEDALASFRRALEIDPDSTVVRSSLLSLQHYIAGNSAADLLAEARQFGDLVSRQASPFTEWKNIPDGERRVRVGLVSPDFHHHPVGHFLEGILAALAADATGQLAIVGYTTNTHSDAVTERIKACCAAWHSATAISDENLARQIRADGVDILIDLSGHTVHNRLPLFAWKPAPVQVSWLGYFATTGVAAIDYLIADPWTLPESEEAHFTEKIWRLPETRLCFTAPDVDIDVAPLPALATGRITFGSFQNPNKLNDAVVALWAKVLRAVPESRMLLKTKQLDNADVRQKLTERFAAHGIDAGRLILEGFSSRAGYLATYQRVDIVLDTFPFPGGTTTVESLWMGVPVLTLAGSSFLARQGVGLLMNAGLPEWIAADADDYVARAAAHAGELPRLAALRAGLRQQVLASPIFDAPRFAGHFEAALRGMWRAWCGSQNGVMKQLSETQSMKTFLHVGCGSKYKDRTTLGFNTSEWKELRLDIDPDAKPDIVGTMLDMSAVADASVDALFSSHNIEHLYPHEVPLALAEFRRVLKPDGFMVITCPDLQSVCQLIAEDKLLEPAYNSPAGPISPLDILYGLRSSLEKGNHYMAHRCGFTEKVLVGTLQDAGFGSVISGRRTHPFYDLWAVASKSILPEERMSELADAHFPE